MTQDNDVIWSRNFTSILLSNGFFFGGFHMLLPTIPLLAMDMGGTKTQVGLIAGIFVLSSVITRLFTDDAVRRFGKRTCLLIGIVLSLASSLAYIAAPTVAVLLWVRILHGVGFGIGTTFYIAVVADFIPATRRGEGLGYFGLATTIAMAVAPATGLAMSGALGFPAMFVLSAGLEFLAMLMLFGCSFQEQASAPVAARTWNGRSFLNVIVEPGTAFAAILVILFGVAHGSILNFIAVRATELHLANPGAFFIVGTGCIFLARLATGKIYDRKGPAWVMIPGAVLLFGGLVTVSSLHSMTFYLAASVLHGFGVGMLYPALQTEIINAVQPNRRSGASATFSNAFDVGLGGGSVLLGLYAEHAGLASAYLCAAAAVGVLLVVYVGRMVAERATGVVAEED